MLTVIYERGGEAQKIETKEVELEGEGEEVRKQEVQVSQDEVNTEDEACYADAEYSRGSPEDDNIYDTLDCLPTTFGHRE